jgi:hypothetical protein
MSELFPSCYCVNDWRGCDNEYAYVPSIGDAILTSEGLLVRQQKALVGSVEVALCECWGSCVDTDGFHEAKTLINLPIKRGKRKCDAMVRGGVTITSLYALKMLKLTSNE